MATLLRLHTARQALRLRKLKQCATRSRHCKPPFRRRRRRRHRRRQSHQHVTKQGDRRRLHRRRCRRQQLRSRQAEAALRPRYAHIRMRCACARNRARMSAVTLDAAHLLHVSVLLAAVSGHLPCTNIAPVALWHMLTKLWALSVDVWWADGTVLCWYSHVALAVQVHDN